MLETALANLQASESRILLVMHTGKIVGLVTMDNVGEFHRNPECYR
jgi:CBS domain containing-hemolysin-like protein